MKALRRALIALLLLPPLLVVCAGIAVLTALNTEQGTRWVLDQAQPLLREQGIDVSLGGSHGALLGRLELSAMAIDVAGNRIIAERVLLHWRPRSLLRRHLHIVALEIDGLDVTPAPATDATPFEMPQVPSIELPGTVTLQRLVIDGLVVRQESGDLDFDRIALAADLDRQRLALRGLRFAGLGLRAQGDLGLGLALPHPVDGVVALAVDKELTGPEVGTVEAHARLGGLLLHPELALDVASPTPIDALGRIDLAAPQPRLRVEIAWPQLRWPLHGDETLLRLDRGRLRLTGTVDDYRLEATTTLTGPDLPETGIALQGQGSLQGLRLAPLRLDVLDGQVEAQGRLDWSPTPAWDLGVVASELDPGVLVSDLSGRLGGRIVSSGVVADGDGAAGSAVKARVEIEALSGVLNEYPVAASGRLEIDGPALKLTALDAASGPNRVRVDGRISDMLELRFDVDAPDLAAAYPDLSGSLRGQGRIGGTTALPTVVAELQGRALRFDDAALAELDLQVDWGGADGHARLALRDGEYSGQPVRAVDARLAGSPQQHDLELSLDSESVRGALAAHGGWQAEAWDGRLTTLQLDVPQPDGGRPDGLQLGVWRLQRPAALRLAADRVAVERVCLAQAPARVCAEGSWRRSGGIDARAELRDLDLATLAPLMPGEAAVEGVLAADAAVTGRVDAPRATFDVRPADGVIRLATDDEAYVLPYRGASISGGFADDRGEARLRLGIGDDGTAAGRVTLGPAPGGVQGGRALGGRVQIAFPDLTLVSGFVPDLRQVRGGLQLRADLAGTLDTPEARGELRIDDAQASLPAVGIELAEIDLVARADGAGPIDVQGRLRSGEGVLQIAGDIGLGAGLPVDLAVTGDRFLAVQLPEAEVLVSPDLRLDGSHDYRLSGTLRIPQARIEIQSVPTAAVRVSDDEIIVGKQPDDVQPRAAPTRLSGKVRVELGDAVQFEGFGLRTGLEGALAVGFGQRGTEVDGRISMRDGRYESFGQDLTIEQGRLLFAGPPDRPELDLRASRRSRDGSVTAYLAMTGPLVEPRPRIYTEPSLPQEEALAYLVTGRGLSQANSGEGFNIANAAFALGVAQGEPWLQDLSNRFGLDDLRIETGDSGFEQSSLVLGKYLDPNLYVGYTQELFNPEGALLLRLRLSKLLEVETRSGRSQSVDFIFRREHD